MSTYGLEQTIEELREKLAQAEDRYHALAAATEGLCAEVECYTVDDGGVVESLMERCRGLIQHQTPTPAVDGDMWQGKCAYCGMMFRAKMRDRSEDGKRFGAACPRCHCINGPEPQDRDVAGAEVAPHQCVSIDGREA